MMLTRSRSTAVERSLWGDIGDSQIQPLAVMGPAMERTSGCVPADFPIINTMGQDLVGWLGSKGQMRHPDDHSTGFLPDHFFFSDLQLGVPGRASFYQRRWAQMEPNAPVGAVHTYDWSATDRVFFELAQGVDSGGSPVTNTWAVNGLTLDMGGKILVGQEWMTGDAGGDQTGPSKFPGSFLADFDLFVNAYLDRYGAVLSWVAFENEPEADNFNIMSPADFETLTQRAWTLVDTWNTANPGDELIVLDAGQSSRTQGNNISRIMHDGGNGDTAGALAFWNLWYARRGVEQGGLPQVADATELEFQHNRTNNLRWFDFHQSVIALHQWAAINLPNLGRHVQVHAYDIPYSRAGIQILHDHWKTQTGCNVTDVIEFGDYDPSEPDNPAPSGPGVQSTNPEAELVLGVANHAAAGGNNLTQLPTTTVLNVATGVRDWEERWGLVDAAGNLRGIALRFFELSELVDPGVVVTVDGSGNPVTILGDANKSIAIADLTDGTFNTATGRFDNGDAEYGWRTADSGPQELACAIFDENFTFTPIVTAFYPPITALPSALVGFAGTDKPPGYGSSRLLGWLYSDATFNDKGTTDTEDDVWSIQITGSKRAHCVEILDHYGLSYSSIPGGNGGITGVRIPGYVTDDVAKTGFLYEDPALNSDITDAEAFLASIIENEGSTAGKIYDGNNDPGAANGTTDGRRVWLDNMYKAAGLTTSDPFAFNMFATIDTEWPGTFGTWPFVTCSRVPEAAGQDNCTGGANVPAQNTW